MRVVGESFHQDILVWAHEQQRRHGALFDVALVPEPRNPHDRNAIRVDLITSSGPRAIGHIPRNMTREWHEVLREAPRGVLYTWPAELSGGDGYPVGVTFLAQA